MGAVYVETMRRLPLAHRALQSWERLAVLGEGQPLSWDALLAISQAMLELNHPIAAGSVIISADLYLRQSDWDVIREGDVYLAPDGRVAVLLGVAERGETTKTGTRQGVLADRSGIADLLLQYKKKARKGGRLFGIRPAEFSAAWRAACETLHIKDSVPHSIRHIGPSYGLSGSDEALSSSASAPSFEATPKATKAYRTLDQIRTRGRWRAKTSVLRYGKTHYYLKAESETPRHLRRVGALRKPALGTRPSKAIDF